MKTLLITFLSAALLITSYDRTQDAKIAALDQEVMTLKKRCTALERQDSTFKAGIVKSNEIVAYPPLIVRDSTDVIKIIEIKK